VAALTVPGEGSWLPSAEHESAVDELQQTESGQLAAVP
jgi:hypothetical protein